MNNLIFFSIVFIIKEQMRSFLTGQGYNFTMAIKVDGEPGSEPVWIKAPASGPLREGHCHWKNCTTETPIMGNDYCTHHLKTELHLQIKPSPIAGLGVFAVGPTTKIIFKAGPGCKPIIRYHGTKIKTEAEQIRLYPDSVAGETVAPYAVQNYNNITIDAARNRSVASFFNHRGPPFDTSTDLNNAEYSGNTDGSKPITFNAIYPKKDIYGGEEITWSYGDATTYWQYNQTEENAWHRTTNTDEEEDPKIGPAPKKKKAKKAAKAVPAVPAVAESKPIKPKKPKYKPGPLTGKRKLSMTTANKSQRKNYAKKQNEATEEEKEETRLRSQERSKKTYEKRKANAVNETAEEKEARLVIRREKYQAKKNKK